MTRRSMFVLLLIGILLASCGGQSAGEPTPDVNATIAANAETMVAALFQTQTALAPAATNTPQPTVTPLPTTTALTLTTPTTFVNQPVFVAATATPTGTFYTATPLNSSLAVGCNNLRIINTYTSPDGPFNPGQDFTQSWQVENSGSCNWMFVYAVQYVSGDKLGEATSVRLGKQIPPGKWTTLSVTMHAPQKSGTYKASWKLTDGSKPFGEVLPVNITVGGPTKTPEVSSTPNAAQTQAAAIQQTVDAANMQATIQAGVVGTQSAVAATNAAALATQQCIDAGTNPAGTPNPPCAQTP